MLSGDCWKLAGYTGDNPIIINAAKGLEDKTYKRLSQVIEEEIPQARVVVLSVQSCRRGSTGYSHYCSEQLKGFGSSRTGQDIFMCSSFRVYTNPDLISVETGGALKILCTGSWSQCRTGLRR